MSKKLKQLVKRYLALLLIPLIAIIATPVVGAGVDNDFIQPTETGLYGGLIHWVEVIDLGNGMSRVFVTTQSANTMFYTDIDHTKADPFEDVVFQEMPDLNADAGFGEIQNFAVDERSGWVYFTWWPENSSSLDEDDNQPGIYRCNIQANSLEQIEFESEMKEGPDSGPGLGYVNQLTIYNGYMFFVEQTWSQELQTDVLRLRHGIIDEETGEFTENDGSPVKLRNTNNGSWIKAPVVNPYNDYVYILDCGQNWDNQHTDSVIYKSSNTYDALTSTTTFKKIIPPPGSTEMPRQYEALGIAPDGVIYLAGWQQTNRNYSESVVVFSSNNGVSWQTGTRDEYCWAWQGPNFAFVDNDSGGYDIITGTMFSEDGGVTWGMLPRTGNVWPHPGSIAFDPNDESAFYVQMDRGIAVSTDAGYSFARAWVRPENTYLEDIEVIDLGGDISGIYIRENECSNPGDPYTSPKVYYAEINHSGDTPVYGDFHAVPSMGDGSSWQIWSQFTGDSTSGYIFFEGTPDNDNHDLNGLYRTNGKTTPVKVTIESGYASRPLIYDGYMFFVNSSWGGGYWVDGYWTDGYWEGDPQWVEGYEDEDGDWIEGYWTEGENWVEGYWTDGYFVEGTPASTLYYGRININGEFVSIGEAEITADANLWPERMAINPSDGSIYILSRSNENGISMFASSDAYDELSDTTTFTVIDPPEGGTYNWNAFGICPDGILVLAGWAESGSGENTIAYSENDGESWEIVAIDNEYCGIGNEFAFLDTDSGYDIFCGTLVSDDNGANWSNLPRRDYDKATPNSACIQIDPNNPEVLYIPTSKGIGYSTDAGYHFSDMNDGIEAVQIKDIVLDPVSNTGWAVAKSGVYRVSNYETDPLWSAPMDPDDSGNWYEVVEMDLTDETGNTAYVGTEWGDRVFMTTDGGSHWKSLWRPQPQFDPDELPNNWCYPNWAGNVSSIKVDPYDSDRIFMGYDTGIWGWGENMEERVFGQLWVYEEDSVEVEERDPEDMWWGPQNTDWTRIPLYRSENDAKEMIESGSDGENTWYTLKGDINILDILITQENGETVIYVAASYSDETATPISDQEKMYNGLYDSSGYPLVYDIFRITGDISSGWDVDRILDTTETSITTLSIDSDGTLYAYGLNYDDAVYEQYLEDYMEECREEAKANDKANARQHFYKEVYKGFYVETIARLYDIGDGYVPGYDKGWDDHFEEMYGNFYDKYFGDYSGAYDDDFEAYFKQCVDEFFEAELLKEFEKHFDEDWEQHNDYFENFWEHSKPQPGLKSVYKRALGGEWEMLPIDGLNKAFTMHNYYNGNEGTMTIAPDPVDSAVEIPYVAFNRFIYYLPDGADEWVLGCEYPLGTEIYVIVNVPSVEEASVDTTAPAEGASVTSSGNSGTILASIKDFFDITPKTALAAEDEGSYLYVGTGTGLYGQIIVHQAGANSGSNGNSAGSTIALYVIFAAAAIVMAKVIHLIWRHVIRI